MMHGLPQNFRFKYRNEPNFLFFLPSKIFHFDCFESLPSGPKKTVKTVEAVLTLVGAEFSGLAQNFRFHHT